MHRKLILLCVAASLSPAAVPDIVKVDAGRVKGTMANGVVAFKGTLLAAPRWARSGPELPYGLAAPSDVIYPRRWYNGSAMTGLDIQTVQPPLRIDAHGVCRVADTRVTLLTLVEAFLEGATPEEICQGYPSVALADVYAVIAFYLGDRGEIDAYLDTVRAGEARIIEQVKLPSPLSEIRRRLLARKTQLA